MGMEIPQRQSSVSQVQTLIARKDLIQTELETQISILKSNSVDFSTPLVDGEGFPRPDIDVWAVRTARVRIIELRNDYKAIMDEIGKALENVYDPNNLPPEPELEPEQSGHEATTGSPTFGVSGITEVGGDIGQIPFARVDGVAPGSPAATSGLLREDLVLSFGDLTHASFNSPTLQPLADYVASKENSEIVVKVRRAGETRTLTFVPRRGWGGRGLVGCHLVPHY